MPMKRIALLFRMSSALALMLALAGCTKGGTFDPSEAFNADMFDSKKKIQGERVPVFPNGVPGATTGVPPDLVKGYQPPPEQADATAAPAPAAKAEKPKPPPKPRLAATPTPTQQQQPQKQDPVWNQPPVAAAAPAPTQQQQPQKQDPVWNQPPVAAAAAAPAPKRISVGTGSQQSGGSAPQQAEPSQSSAQSPWPAPPQPAAQSPWPAPPQPATASQAPWPNAPAPARSSQ